MARTVKEIQQEILKAKENEPALNELSSTSKTAVWRLWIYVFSLSLYTQELLFNSHSSDMDIKIREFRAGSVRWYRNEALGFQYGFPYDRELGDFKSASSTQEEIDNSKIIKYAAVTETTKGKLIVKIATEDNSKLTPINESQFNSFKAYFKDIKYAGTHITYINYLPDLLKLKLRIVRDALILNEEGMHILEGNFPVNDTIKLFLKKLPFDGQLSLQKLEESLLDIQGVTDLSLDAAQTAWIDPNVGNYGAYENIDISKIPVSGYFEVNLENDGTTKSDISYV